MTLDYRSPQTHEHRVQKVLAELSQDEVIGLVEIGMKLVFGLPLCFFAPFVVTSAVGYVTYRIRIVDAPGFLTMLAFFSIILIPLLFWYERRGHGEILWDSLRHESGHFSGIARRNLSVGSFAMLLELALFGPKLVWSAIDRIRDADPVDQPTRTAAATIVVLLLQAEDSVRIGSLFSAQFTHEEIASALKYLHQRAWIILSRKRDRVTLSYSIRRQLKGI